MVMSVGNADSTRATKARNFFSEPLKSTASNTKAPIYKRLVMRRNSKVKPELLAAKKPNHDIVPKYTRN